MRLQPTIVSLGGASWRVRPLTVAQVQEIEPMLEAQASAQNGSNGGGSIRSAIAILRVALGRDHPEAVAPLGELEAGASEIAAALAQVLRLAGFLSEDPSRASRPGEGDADRAENSTGPRSTPA